MSTTPRHRYDVDLDGVSIRSLSPLIKVTKISERAPKYGTDTAGHPGRIGQILVNNSREELAVQVTFVLTERFDVVARAAAIEAVNEWAKPGMLAVSYRPDRVLFVNAVTERPAVDDIKSYTSEYTLTFTAYALPYWVDAQPIVSDPVKIGNGTAVDVAMTITGNRPAYLEATITPEENTSFMGTVSIAIGTDYLLEWDGSIASGGSLILDYTLDHYQHLHYAGDSSFERISAISTDHLIVEPGENTITVNGTTTTGNANVILSARGVYA